MLRYTVLFHRNQEVPGYSVLVPELPGCFSQGHTLDEALAHAKEAIQCHLEAMAEDGEQIPVEREPFPVATVAVEPPSIGTTTLSELFERLKADIAARSGCQIQAKALDTRGYNLGAPKVFAHAWKHSRKGHLEVVTKKEWVDKAEVPLFADRCDDKGYYGEPACYWNVRGAQTDSYGRAVQALSKICIVRQHLGR